jgi:hypothetical protein
MIEGMGEDVIVHLCDEFVIDDGIRELVIEIAIDVPVRIFYDDLRGGRNAIFTERFRDNSQHSEHVRHAREKPARIDRLPVNVREGE